MSRFPPKQGIYCNVYNITFVFSFEAFSLYLELAVVWAAVATEIKNLVFQSQLRPEV